MIVEILPNELPVIVSNLIFAMIFAILTQAGLAFIGLGDPTMLTWGNMLNIAYRRRGADRSARGGGSSRPGSASRCSARGCRW